MKDRQGFGNRIKEMREQRNLTIEQAAELCDCSESTWKQYERGERLPSVPKLKSICLVLKVKPEYIYGSELDGLQEDISEVEQLKLKIEQLSSDDIAVIKAAVEKAGSTADMSASDLCEALKTAMTEITIDGVTAKSLTWEASGEPSKEPMVVKIANGDYAVVE